MNELPLNEIIHGDCLEVMRQFPDKSIDMILCDLPYGVTACKWDKIIPFEPLWEQYERIIKDNGAIVLFGSEPFSSALRMSNIKLYKYDWIWDKVNRYTGYCNCKNAPFIPWAKDKEKRLCIDNGITLCPECHAKKHPKIKGLIKKARYAKGE